MGWPSRKQTTNSGEAQSTESIDIVVYIQEDQSILQKNVEKLKEFYLNNNSFCSQFYSR